MVIESEYVISKGLMGDFSILIVVPIGLRFMEKPEYLEESV